MTKRKLTRKFAVAKKKLLALTDSSIKSGGLKPKRKQEDNPNEIIIKKKEQVTSGMFLSYNTNIGPPFHILVDTNYINFSLKNHLDLFESIVQCLDGTCHLYITDCVMGELEKMGKRYRVAIKIARDPRMKRLVCQHRGIYADDCLVKRVTENRCYVVATCDKELKGRLRKIPGVPLLSIKGHNVEAEKMPDSVNSK